MKKEELFERLKDSILTIVRKNDELRTNSLLRLKWLENSQKIDAALKELNSCDMLWLNDEYGKWFKDNKEIQDGYESRRKVVEQYSNWF